MEVEEVCLLSHHVVLVGVLFVSFFLRHLCIKVIWHPQSHDFRDKCSPKFIQASRAGDSWLFHTSNFIRLPERLPSETCGELTVHMLHQVQWVHFVLPLNWVSGMLCAKFQGKYQDYCDVCRVETGQCSSGCKKSLAFLPRSNNRCRVTDGLENESRRCGGTCSFLRFPSCTFAGRQTPELLLWSTAFD